MAGGGGVEGGETGNIHNEQQTTRKNTLLAHLAPTGSEEETASPQSILHRKVRARGRHPNVCAASPSLQRVDRMEEQRGDGTSEPAGRHVEAEPWALFAWSSGCQEVSVACLLHGDRDHKLRCIVCHCRQTAPPPNEKAFSRHLSTKPRSIGHARRRVRADQPLPNFVRLPEQHGQRTGHSALRGRQVSS